MAQYFALEANQTRRELHVLYPVHHDAAGWFSRYLTTWMSNVGKLGVDSPYLDQLGAMPGTSTPSPPALQRRCQAVTSDLVSGNRGSGLWRGVG